MEERLTIRDMTSGLVRIEENQPLLYGLSKNLIYEENSQCLVEKNVVGCMRFGFQLDWESELNRTVLNCSTLTSNRVRKHGDDGDMGDVVNITNFEIELEGENGTYVHPFRYFNYGHQKYRRTTFKTQCSFDGAAVIDSTTELVENP